MTASALGLNRVVMKNYYEVKGIITEIFIKRKSGEIIKVLIDTDDLYILQKFPNTWSLDGIRSRHPRNRTPSHFRR